MEPGTADAPDGSAGNANLGSVPQLSRPRRKAAAKAPPSALRAQLDALFRDTAACAEAARRWSDGPGRLWRDALPAQAGAAAALEHLSMHTALMQVMNWLLDPEHAGAIVGTRAFTPTPLPPLPADHPIRSTEGRIVAETSRALQSRAITLAAAHPLPAQDQP